MIVREIKSDEIEKTVESIDASVNGLVVDRSVDQKLLDRLVMKGLEYVAASDFKGIIKRPLNIRLMKIG
jgi:DNA primase